MKCYNNVKLGTKVKYFGLSQSVALSVLQKKVFFRTLFQVDCSIPWLSDCLFLFSAALQLCQQLKDKVCRCFINSVYLFLPK